jgi:hypothetical protein
MARLSVDTKISSRQEFQDLLIKMGDRQKAKGICWELWELAQKYWFPDRKLIPENEITKANLEIVIEVGLAERRADGIYAKGSEEQFAWLFQKQAAGQKKKKPRTKRVKSDDKHPLADDNGTKRDETSLLPSTFSFLPSPSSNLDSYSVGGESSIPPVAEIKNPVGFFIGRYVKAYQKRYGPKARPPLEDGKVQGQIKNFVKEFPLERACQLIEIYCGMGDSWFLTKGHDFGTFRENLTKVGLKLDTGVQTDRIQIKHEEQKNHAISQLERIAQGKL